MISKIHLQWLIRNQKVAARKSIAVSDVLLYKCAPHERERLLKIVSNEKQFINHSFSEKDNLQNFLSVMHNLRHDDLSKHGSPSGCIRCKMALADMAIELPGAPAEETNPEPNKEDQLKPRFGNLLAVLEQEVKDEWAHIERKRMPSQNDITRWALKKVVFEYYKGLNLPENIVVVDTLYDDRLTHKLAPDFDVIAEKWMGILDELQRRNDKYALNMDEYDKSDSDLADGMRGSAFEKQLDRYREEFMSKLMR